MIDRGSPSELTIGVVIESEGAGGSAALQYGDPINSQPPGDGNAWIGNGASEGVFFVADADGVLSSVAVTLQEEELTTSTEYYYYSPVLAKYQAASDKLISAVQLQCDASTCYVAIDRRVKSDDYDDVFTGGSIDEWIDVAPGEYLSALMVWDPEASSYLGASLYEIRYLSDEGALTDGVEWSITSDAVYQARWLFSYTVPALMSKVEVQMDSTSDIGIVAWVNPATPPTLADPPWGDTDGSSDDWSAGNETMNLSDLTPADTIYIMAYGNDEVSGGLSVTATADIAYKSDEGDLTDNVTWSTTDDFPYVSRFLFRFVIPATMTEVTFQMNSSNNIGIAAWVNPAEAPDLKNPPWGTKTGQSDDGVAGNENLFIDGLSAGDEVYVIAFGNAAISGGFSLLASAW